MRSFDPSDEYDAKELARLNAAPWQVELLSLNPKYPHWGPYENYMAKRGKNEPADEFGRNGSDGWDTRALYDNWESFGPWGLDNYNEVVHFYFEISRASQECELCTGSGYHPDALWISESFYSHSSPFKGRTSREDMSRLVVAAFSDRLPREPLAGAPFPTEEVLARYGVEFCRFCEQMRDGSGCWNDQITDDEADALRAANRLTFRGGPNATAAEVNAIQRRGGMDSHDAINRGILIEQRCKRLGVPTICPQCEGHGDVFTAPDASVGLVLWVLHPRKGCSRGVHIKRIEQAELPAVFAYLRAAAERNAQRFARIPAAEPTDAA